MTYRIVGEKLHKVSHLRTFGELEQELKQELVLVLTPIAGSSKTFEHTWPNISLNNFFPIRLRGHSWPKGIVPYIIMDNNEDPKELTQLETLITQAAKIISKESIIQFRRVQTTDNKCVLFRFPTIYEENENHPYPFGCPQDSSTLTVYVPKLFNNMDYSAVTVLLNLHISSDIVNMIINYYQAPKVLVDLQYITDQMLEILGINLVSGMSNQYFSSPAADGLLHHRHSEQLNRQHEYVPPCPCNMALSHRIS